MCLLQRNTPDLSVSEEPSRQANCDSDVSELRQVLVPVDHFALETVSVSKVENSSPPINVITETEEDQFVRSDYIDQRITRTTINEPSTDTQLIADDRSELANGILVESPDATSATLATEHSDFVVQLFDTASATEVSDILFQSFYPTTGDAEVSVEPSPAAHEPGILF